MNKVLKGVFWIAGMCLMAMLLYRLFFVGDNSVISTVCRNVELPISQYYYDATLYPSVHCKEGIAESMGITTRNGVSNLDTVDIDDSSVVADYSTGWY